MYPIDFFWRAAAHYPDRPAVIDSDGAISFSDLATQVAALALALQVQDPSPDGRVAIGSSNSRRHLIALLAVLASGRTWVPLNPRAGTPDLKRIVAFTEPGVLLLDAAMMERLADSPCRSVDIDGKDFDRAIARYQGRTPEPAARDLGDVQAVKFTGGTTGTPKGVMQPFRSWNTVVASQWHAFGFDVGDRFLVSAPLTHGSSTYVLPVLGAGGCLVFPAESRAPALLQAIEANAVTTLFLPPVLVNALVAENRLRRHDTSSLRAIIYGAAPMAAEQIAQARSAFGPVLATTYGQTEAPQIITCLSSRELCEARYAASVGRPSLLTQVAIMDNVGQQLDAGTEGEICVRGDLVMSGYWRSPDKTNEVFRNGWLRTGDIGLFDEDGYLFLRGRKSDVIISGGFNVYPSDVETAIQRHSAVSDCAVVGIADDKWGEAVHAAVCLREGQTLTESELIAFTKNEIGSVNAPKAIYFFEKLPRTAVDKVSRAAVSALIKERIGKT